MQHNSLFVIIITTLGKREYEPWHTHTHQSPSRVSFALWLLLTFSPAAPSPRCPILATWVVSARRGRQSSSIVICVVIRPLSRGCQCIWRGLHQTFGFQHSLAGNLILISLRIKISWFFFFILFYLFGPAILVEKNFYFLLTKIFFFFLSTGWRHSERLGEKNKTQIFLRLILETLPPYLKIKRTTPPPPQKKRMKSLPVN